MEMLARCLPTGRGAIEQAHDAQRDATAVLDEARAVPTLARSEVRAVGTLIEQRGAKKQSEENRRDQGVSDNVSGWRLGRTG